jgi:tRNA 2-thiocytidine biosynthesis protein TtcA
MGFPIIPCNLCGSQENLQRNEVKAMLADWERRYPGRIESIAGSLGNVVPEHLMDTRLFDFAGLQAPPRAAAGPGRDPANDRQGSGRR